jgi:dolichol-phosphate mannosyltransferase
MNTLVVIPTYNECDNLPRLVEAVLAVDPGVHVLVVDDNSPDGTGAIADQLVARDARTHVLHRSGKLGLASAYLEGFRFALRGAYDRIVQMDADFSHRPEDLSGLLHAAEKADVVLGSRYVPGGHVHGWSPLRHLISRGGSLYARVVLGVRRCGT